jgi:nitrate reductase gamma subunit
VNASWFDTFFFGYYPYIALAIFFVGSLLRFDRDQYSWKSDSSQLLRAGSLRWGSNLFHLGILFLLGGHTVGMLTPHAVYEPFISAGGKQLVAMVSGGLFGVLGFAGVTILLHRRLTDPRIRRNSRTSDIALLVIIWLQFALGLATIPLSAHHLDGGVMMKLAGWAQGVVTLRADAGSITDVDTVFKLHMILGMTVFVIFPFTRLVHVWSGFATVFYALRPYQLVRSRRLNLPAGHLASRRTLPMPAPRGSMPAASPTAHPPVVARPAAGRGK